MKKLQGALEGIIQEATQKVEPINDSLLIETQRRLDNLTKPQGSLGRLEEFARTLVAITDNLMPALDKKIIFTFAGDHGVASDGVSAFPKEVTPQMVLNFIRGGAGINVLARHAGAEVAVVDIGVDYDFGAVEGLISRKIVHGTKSIRTGAAMTREEALRCIEVGAALAAEYAAKGYKIMGTGEMGIGNTTPSSAIAAVLTGLPAADVTGRGTGITDDSLRRKIAVIEEAIKVNAPDASDALDVLAKLGGAEIAGIAGLCIGCAMNRVPVVIDGFISTAGALIATRLVPAVGGYLFSAHKSVEKGHMAMLDAMGLRPIIDLDLRLGEGTGAALAMHLIEGGLKIYKEMATFESAGVSDKAI